MRRRTKTRSRGGGRRSRGGPGGGGGLVSGFMRRKDTMASQGGNQGKLNFPFVQERKEWLEQERRGDKVGGGYEGAQDED